MSEDAGFQKYCQGYFNRIQASNNLVLNSDTAKERDKVAKRSKLSRPYLISGKYIKSPGPDIVADVRVDQIGVSTFGRVPLPVGRELDLEYHFLIMDGDSGVYASKVFQMPGNGGHINYSCQIGSRINWSRVAAAAHTHPLYKNESTVNRLNKYFSAGDPSVLLMRQIPLYLRTPKGKYIKVLEIRNGYVTTRVLDGSGKGKIKKWKAMGG